MEKAPDAFRTISEVADDLDIPQHVLRFWESRFAQIKPMKRGGGRRYYRPDDVALLRGIRHLLYGQGYTIRGVQRILREQGVRFVQVVWEEGAEPPPPPGDDGAVDDDAAPIDVEDTDLEAQPTASPGERREPTLAVPRREAAVAPIPRRGGLTAPDREALKAALTELTECCRVLEAARDDAA